MVLRGVVRYDEGVWWRWWSRGRWWGVMGWYVVGVSRGRWVLCGVVWYSIVR